MDAKFQGAWFWGDFGLGFRRLKFLSQFCHRSSLWPWEEGWKPDFYQYLGTEVWWKPRCCQRKLAFLVCLDWCQPQLYTSETTSGDGLLKKWGDAIYIFACSATSFLDHQCIMEFIFVWYEYCRVGRRCKLKWLLACFHWHCLLALDGVNFSSLISCCPPLSVWKSV